MNVTDGLLLVACLLMIWWLSTVKLDE